VKRPRKKARNILDATDEKKNSKIIGIGETNNG